MDCYGLQGYFDDSGHLEGHFVGGYGYLKWHFADGYWLQGYFDDSGHWEGHFADGYG